MPPVVSKFDPSKYLNLPTPREENLDKADEALANAQATSEDVLANMTSLRERYHQLVDK
jgi:hypothetical protein